MKRISIVIAILSLVSVSSAQTSSLADRAAKTRLELAGILIEALDKNDVCDVDAYPSEINDLVMRANIVLEDADMQAWVDKLSPSSKIREDLAFRQSVQAVNLNGKVSKSDVEKQLTGTKFYKFGQGAYGSPQNIKLEAGGKATVFDLELLDHDPYFTWKSSVTTWEVVLVKESFGHKAVLKIGTTSYAFEEKDGEIWIVPQGVPADQLIDKTLTTTDSYCDA